MLEILAEINSNICPIDHRGGKPSAAEAERNGGKIMAEKEKKTETLEQTAYRKIKEDILTLRYEPGSMLTEKQLSEKLSISRTPIRAALTRLVYEKIVSEDATGHIYVAQTTVKEVEDITAVRLALEPLALDGPNLIPAFIKNIETIYKAQKKVDISEKSGLITYAKLDCDFHCAIAELSDNDVLKNDIRSLNAAMVRCNVLSDTLRFNVPDAIREHGEILTYLKEGKTDFAKLALVNHINFVNNRMFF